MPVVRLRFARRLERGSEHFESGGSQAAIRGVCVGRSSPRQLQASGFSRGYLTQGVRADPDGVGQALAAIAAPIPCIEHIIELSLARQPLQ